MEEINSDYDDIPILDLRGIDSLEASENDFMDIGLEMSKAFEKIGFIYLKNHGIPTSLIDLAQGVGRTFFSLPEDKKMEYPYQEKLNHGYQGFNYEKFQRHKEQIEFRQSFNISDLKCQEGGAVPAEDIVPELHSVVHELHGEGRKLARKILKALDVALDTNGTLLAAHGTEFCLPENVSNFRLIHYPPVPDNLPLDNLIRCGTHSDYGTFTLLFQDDVGGLEVKNRHGVWAQAKPMPGTILVNVGDLLQYWTNDLFVATKHRVLLPENVEQRRRERNSIAFFIHPLKDAVIESLVGEAKYPAVKASEHMLAKLKATH